MIGSLSLSLLLVAVSHGALDSQELFNGRDLDGWVVEGPKEFKNKESGKTVPIWKVEDGTIRCEGRGFGFLRYEKTPFADFDLHVECKLAAAKSNTGLGIRTTSFNPMKSRETRPSFYSYEIQLQADAGKPANEHCSGSLYRYVKPKENAIKPVGEWNEVDVSCRGPRIKIVLNGKEIIDFDQSTDPKLKDKPLKGFVALQTHTELVFFKNIRIREVKTGER